MKLFVGLGNLGIPRYGDDDKITSSDLRPLFEKYGVVTECECISNKNYAFVHMEEDSQGTAAVRNLDGHWIKGRSIKVETGEMKGPRRFASINLDGTAFDPMTIEVPNCCSRLAIFFHMNKCKILVLDTFALCDNSILFKKWT